jgi:hypothetical protein
MFCYQPIVQHGGLEGAVGCNRTDSSVVEGLCRLVKCLLVTELEVVGGGCCALASSTVLGVCVKPCICDSDLCESWFLVFCSCCCVVGNGSIVGSAIGNG